MYKPGSSVNLVGYTSTSKDMQIAVGFAIHMCKQDEVPVVLEIKFESQYGFIEL